MALETLKELLKEKAVTQAEIAKIIGCVPATMTHLFTGRRNLRADEAQKIALRLGVPIEKILNNAPVIIPDKLSDSGLHTYALDLAERVIDTSGLEISHRKFIAYVEALENIIIKQQNNNEGSSLSDSLAEWILLNKFME